MKSYPTSVYAETIRTLNKRMPYKKNISVKLYTYYNNKDYYGIKKCATLR